ncbi:MAG: elongation factor P [Anaerolineales bacterium]|nr:elongation factor P [Anaerolineales bacterium]
MIDVNDLRKGVTFELDGNLFKVIEYSHHKPGRGNATIKIKARNLRTGANLEKTFISGSQVQDAPLDFHNVQYLYSDGEFYHFMDNDTYEQPAIKSDLLGDDALFLMENMEVKLTFYQDEPISIELPMTVEMKIVEADVAVRGDTATGVTKKVKTETGLEVQVPQFVERGDRIRIDTRTGTYVTRV